MACDLCKDLPLSIVTRLNDEISAGERSITDIAATYSVEIPALENHINLCVRSSRPGYALLENMLNSLNTAAAARKQAFDDRPMNSEAMEHYIALQREARATILAMERVRPPEDLVLDIIQQVLRPLMNQWLSILIEESNKLRLDVTSFVDPSLYLKVDVAVKQLLRRVGLRLEQARAGVVPRLQRVMNANSTVAAESPVDAESAEQVAEDEMSK